MRNADQLVPSRSLPQEETWNSPGRSVSVRRRSSLALIDSKPGACRGTDPLPLRGRRSTSGRSGSSPCATTRTTATPRSGNTRARERLHFCTRSSSPSSVPSRRKGVTSEPHARGLVAERPQGQRADGKGTRGTPPPASAAALAWRAARTPVGGGADSGWRSGSRWVPPATRSRRDWFGGECFCLDTTRLFVCAEGLGSPGSSFSSRTGGTSFFTTHSAAPSRAHPARLSQIAAPAAPPLSTSSLRGAGPITRTATPRSGRAGPP
jgi:hypothetical protein